MAENDGSEKEQQGEPDKVTRADRDGFIARFIEKHGGERKALEVLADETLTTRRQRRYWKERYEDAVTKAIPEGAVVLTGDDAKVYEAYKALGTPDEITAGLGERDTLKQTVAQVAAKQSAQTAATLAGFKADKAADLLLELAELKKFAIAVEEKDGAETAFAVIGEGDEATRVPLAEYATEHLAAYLPALQASETPKTPDRQYPRQTSTQKPAAPANVDQLAQAKKSQGSYSGII